VYFAIRTIWEEIFIVGGSIEIEALVELIFYFRISSFLYSSFFCTVLFARINWYIILYTDINHFTQKDFAEVFKTLVKYRSENNFSGSLK